MAILSVDPTKTAQRRARMRDELDLFFHLFSDDEGDQLAVAKRVRAAILDGRVKGNDVFHRIPRGVARVTDKVNCGCLAGLACFEALELGILTEDLDWFPGDEYNNGEPYSNKEDLVNDAGNALLDAVQGQRDGDLGRIDDDRMEDTYGLFFTYNLPTNFLLLEDVIYDVRPGETPDNTPALAELVTVLDAWIADHETDPVSATSEA